MRSATEIYFSLLPTVLNALYTCFHVHERPSLIHSTICDVYAEHTKTTGTITK